MNATHATIPGRSKFRALRIRQETESFRHPTATFMTKWVLISES